MKPARKNEKKRKKKKEHLSGPAVVPGGPWGASVCGGEGVKGLCPTAGGEGADDLKVSAALPAPLGRRQTIRAPMCQSRSA